VPTFFVTLIILLVGTLRFAHPTVLTHEGVKKSIDTDGKLFYQNDNYIKKEQS
jgi:hypothetical protein